MNISKWLVAARLRTLPLSLSGVILGLFLGGSELYQVNKGELINNITFYIGCAFFILLTALLLQILSNFANDYGDALSGVDNKERIGPKRGIVTGAMTLKELKIGILVITALALLSGIIAVTLCFYQDITALLLFLVLGALAVVAAITYTVGLVYGYKGLGDISVFIFFGLVSVLGSEYMIAKDISYLAISLGALSGVMSVLVLNVNNLRDYQSDRVTGKRSIVVKLGLKGGKYYHLALLMLTIIVAVYALTIIANIYALVIMLIAFIPLIKASFFCINIKNTDGALDPMLKKTSLGASLVNFIFALVVVFFY